MPAKKKYLPGDIIGGNKIIKEDVEKTNKFHRSFWVCECLNCGNIRTIRNDNIKESKNYCSKCHNTPKKHITDDLTGKIFGYWTVIEKSNKNNYWVCQCKCGTKKDVFRGSLTQGTSKSCGCVTSWGETQIIYLLNKYHINYKKEYSFNDLKQGKLRFDFAIFNNLNNLLCLIEYDGRQHKKFENNWNMSYQDFQQLQKNDSLKNDYCIKNNIILYRLNKETNLEQEIKNIIKYFSLEEVIADE